MTSARTLYFARVFRTAFAVISSLLIAMWMGFANPYWAPTTVLVLESISRFEMLDKTFWRLLGTLIGGSIGIVVVVLCAGTPAAMIIACSISTCVAVFLGQKCNPAFWRWMLFSLLIVALYTVDNPDNAFLIGVYRISGVGLGAFILLLLHLIIPAKNIRTEFSDVFTGMASVLLSLVDRIIEFHEHTTVENPMPLGKLTAQTTSFAQACKLRSKSSLKKRNYLALAVDMDSVGRNLLLLNNPRLTESLSEHNIARLKQIRQQVLKLQTGQLSFKEQIISPYDANESGYLNQLIFEIERSLERISAFLTENADYLQTPPKWMPPVCAETELIGGDKLRLYKAALCGGAVAASMFIWRFLGWPAGSSFVIISIASILYIITPPYFSLKLFVVMYFTASFISGVFSIFVLPQLSDTATFIYVIFAFYSALSLLIQSSNPKLRGLTSLIAILTNSTMNGYIVTSNAFNIYSYIALSLVGAVLLTWLFTKIFFPFSAEDIVLFHQHKLQKELQEFTHAEVPLSDKHLSQIIFRIRTIMGWSLKVPPTPRLTDFLTDAYCLQTILMHPNLSMSMLPTLSINNVCWRRIVTSLSAGFN